MDLHEGYVEGDGKRRQSLQRAGELKQRIGDYLEDSRNIRTGFDNWQAIIKTKHKILNHYGASEDDWQDW